MRTATMDLRESIRNQNDVALGLTKKLPQTKGKESNLVYSPLSIHMVLSLIIVGSKGPTQDQLLSFLKSKSADHLNSFTAELISIIFFDWSLSGRPRLSFANGIWVDMPLPLKPSFKHVVDTAYKAAPLLLYLSWFWSLAYSEIKVSNFIIIIRYVRLYPKNQKSAVSDPLFRAVNRYDRKVNGGPVFITEPKRLRHGSSIKFPQTAGYRPNRYMYIIY
ncbi:hypothetical protein PRUPE_3G141200 [Prunus persica]|uniref:Serpin domain-containing protein n=1 Tax=Prunus persica TaxID=3760 RepID=A0A251Q064_PRUPE|nr:hypothetical protein PRUPE_3G141200 [Prunus persica]